MHVEILTIFGISRKWCRRLKNVTSNVCELKVRTNEIMGKETSTKAFVPLVAHLCNPFPASLYKLSQY